MHLNVKATLKLSCLKKKEKTNFVIGSMIVKVIIKLFEKVIGKFFTNLFTLTVAWMVTSKLIVFEHR